MLKLQSHHVYPEQLYYVCPQCRSSRRALGATPPFLFDRPKPHHVAQPPATSIGHNANVSTSLQRPHKKKAFQVKIGLLESPPACFLSNWGGSRSKRGFLDIRISPQVRRASTVSQEKSKTKEAKIKRKVTKKVGAKKSVASERRSRVKEAQEKRQSASGKFPSKIKDAKETRGRVRKKTEDGDGVPIESLGRTMKTALGSKSAHHSDLSVKVDTNDLKLEAIPTKAFTVPGLAHGLDRVLFNPGICHVRDPRSRVFNFDPHLEEIMPVQEFDFDTLTMFVTPSQDKTLAKLAADSGKKYFASTSSFTGVLKHFHFLLSDWRELNLNMLSKAFPLQSNKFTKLTRAPDAVFLRYNNGVYAMDADKEYDSANVLSLMGRYMEKLLTLDKESFDKHRVGRSHEISEQERNRPEAYHYSTTGDFVFRSQLDAYDPRLPGTGMFDLKTRAVVPIRADSADFEWGMGYEIRSLRGEWQSFEREYHDMIRSTLLKYSLQARMGRMDGIFVAFHNIARIFGFQYISLDEMDVALHGQSNRHLGDKEFLLSVHLFNRVLDKAVQKFPKQSLRIHVETREASKPFMYIFVEPVSNGKINEVQNKNKEKIRAWEDAILAGRKPEKNDSAQDESNKLEQIDTAENDSETSEKHAKDQQQINVSDMDAMNVEQELTSEFLPPKMTAQKDDNGPETEGHPDPDADSKIKDEATSGPGGDPASVPNTRGDDSITPGDPKYLNSMPKTTEQDKGPLLGMVLDVQSHVNRQRVGRPSNEFTKNDEWETDYTLAEIGIQSRAWAWYEALKSRRAKTFAEEEKQEDKQRDYYFDMLKRITMDSVKWRQELEANEKAEPQGPSQVQMWEPRKGLTDSQAGIEGDHISPSRSSTVSASGAGSKIDAEEQLRRVQEHVIELAKERIKKSTSAKEVLPDDWMETLKQDKTSQKTIQKFIDHFHTVAEDVEKAAARDAAPNLVNSLIQRMKMKSNRKKPEYKVAGEQKEPSKAENVSHSLESPSSSGQTGEAHSGR
ncbi:MAG: hypothetical protein M1831_002075 [Alyxoria varia]|nr:MAG: hypothetical protein M1831_002075 [Alyxoria varia]